MSEKYLFVAVQELGTAEVPGTAANPRIVEYARHTSLKAASDETPWCSSFANFVVDVADGPGSGTGSAAARSWLTWGKQLAVPERGCIVVLDRRDANNPNAAHVCFYVERLEGGRIRCIGGNQGDQVKYSTFLASKVLGYRTCA